MSWRMRRGVGGLGSKDEMRFSSFIFYFRWVRLKFNRRERLSWSEGITLREKFFRVFLGFHGWGC